MAGEGVALIVSLDAATFVAQDLEVIQKKSIYSDMFTGPKQAFYAVSKRRKISEKRLMTDILASHEVNRRFEICGIGLVQRVQNPVDVLNKLKGNKMLNRLIETRRDDTRVMQWIDWSRLETSMIALEK